MIRLGARRLTRLVVLGAHCDDIAIGAGGTLLALATAHPGLRVDALVLSGGYEIVKWDGDLARPNTYQPLSPLLAERKVELLAEHYGSQRHRPWYDSEAFLGLARIRGIECNSRYAEVFHVDKLTLDLEA